ncbi:hypothetical protein GC173_04755 [bacterium]|nr:hypothetical protein [bacterium]
MGGLTLSQSARGYGVAALVLALCHVLVTWPVWSAPSALMPGWSGDNMLFAWNLAWVAHGDPSLEGTGSGTVALFYPEGFPFLFHTHTWLYNCLYKMASPTIGLLVANDPMGRVTLGYNALMMISSIMSGLALVALCRLYGARRWSVIVAMAVIGTFCPARLFSQYGHLNIQGTEFFFWSIYTQARAMKSSGRRSLYWWMAGGGLAGLAFLNDQTLGMFSLLFHGILASNQCVQDLSRWRSIAIAGVALGGVFVAVSLVHLIPLTAVYTSAGYYVASSQERRLNDALNLFLPSDYNWIDLGLFSVRSSLNIPNGTGVGHLPFALLLPAAVAVVLWVRGGVRGPEVRFWLLVFLFGLICTLGEWLTIAGHRIVPLPYRLFRELPVLDNLRIPDRFVYFAIVPMVLAAAWGMERLLERSCRGAIVLGYFMIGVGALEWRLQPIIIRTDVAPHHISAATIADVQARGGSVWSMPARMDNPLANAWQIQHGRPDCFGLIARVPPDLMRTRAERFPFLDWVMHQRDRQWSEAFALHYRSDDSALRENIALFVERFQLRTVLYTSESVEDVGRIETVAPREFWESLGVRFVLVE